MSVNENKYDSNSGIEIRVLMNSEYIGKQKVYTGKEIELTDSSLTILTPNNKIHTFQMSHIKKICTYEKDFQPDIRLN